MDGFPTRYHNRMNGRHNSEMEHKIGEASNMYLEVGLHSEMARTFYTARGGGCEQSGRVFPKHTPQP